MSIERRKSQRLAVSLDVVLNYRAQSVICTIRDIGLGGAFLDADPELLPYAGLVELNFSLPSDTRAGYVRLPATIQRITENGAAVTFGDVGGDIYFRLVDMVAVPNSSVCRPADRRHS